MVDIGEGSGEPHLIAKGLHGMSKKIHVIQNVAKMFPKHKQSKKQSAVCVDIFQFKVFHICWKIRTKVGRLMIECPGVKQWRIQGATGHAPNGPTIIALTCLIFADNV